MQDFTRHSIVAHRFSNSRKKGYDPLEVDGFLERVGEYVGWMQEELARHQATERAAMNVLLQAERTAEETVAAAERDAARIRQNAKVGLENARKDARQTLENARAEADQTLLSARAEADQTLKSARAEADRALLSARSEAEAEVDGSRVRIAELEAEAAVRSKEIDQLMERMRISVTESSSELRSAGSRLLEMADQFQFELATQGHQIRLFEDASVDRQSMGVNVS